MNPKPPNKKYLNMIMPTNVPTPHFVLFTLTLSYIIPFKWFKETMENVGEYMRDEGTRRPMDLRAKRRQNVEQTDAFFNK